MLGEGGLSPESLRMLEEDYEKMMVKSENINLMLDQQMEQAAGQLELIGVRKRRNQFQRRITDKILEARGEIRLGSTERHGNGARGTLQWVTEPMWRRSAYLCSSGKAADYHTFKRVFSELTEGEGYPPAVHMAQLRSHLPREAARLVDGQVEITRAWRDLDEEYGNKKIAILQAIHAMTNVKASGSSHDVVRTVLQAVRTCSASLENSGGRGQNVY